MNRCCTLLVLAGLALSNGPQIPASETSDSDQAVQPLLKKYCTQCHASEKRRAELDLSSISGIQRGSESGRILDDRNPRKGRLYEVLHEREMPPDDAPQPTDAERKAMLDWIETSDWDRSRGQALNQHDVLPILLLRCATCHGRQVQQGGLDLRSRAAMLAGGKSGPALVIGDANASLLIQKIREERMPPRELLAKHSVKPVTPGELGTLVNWINAGAPQIEVHPDTAVDGPDPLVSEQDRTFWAFRAPVRPQSPVLKRGQDSSVETVRNPIDVFIRGRLQKAGLPSNPVASRQSLIRRACFDLTGLPPSEVDIETFSDDPQPGAWSRLIDRLLASPEYGERWGQYWLDLAGYSDSEGVQHSDPIRPHAWRYRDYVIRSWNSNKSYDRFLLEQLAGDELSDYQASEVITQEAYDQLVATGFLRMTSDGTFAGITGFVPNRLDVIDDQIRVLSSAVMGLTIRCARCHSHKFDPIPQRDYYRLSAILKPAMDEHDWLKPVTGGAAQAAGGFRYLPHVTTEERDRWQANENRVNQQISELKAKKSGRENDAEFIKSIEEQIKALEGERKAQPMIRALWDRGQPSPTYILQRGNYLQPGRLVGPGVPSVLTSDRIPFASPSSHSTLDDSPELDGKKTGYRLAMARWLTRTDHPLTARVFVNRIWRHHFGRGIVASLDNFGKAGEQPSHPDLLDWLACEFMDSGWDIKNLHRLIMNSATYRQSSAVLEAAARLDPDNRWLSHMPLRRLEAEALRDTILAVSGQLDRRPFGPADPVEVRGDGLVEASGSSRGYRRSIYVLKRRTQRLTLFDNFDRPRMSPNCVDRIASTVAPQALQLMNNARIHEFSRSLADRIAGARPNSADEQLRLLLRSTTGVTDSASFTTLRRFHDELTSAYRDRLRSEETERSKHDLDQLASRRAFETVCHAVLNSAAFLYID